ncbi:MAG TPA: hypothetical protein VEU50_43010 [Archangium sp.]|nr:hypothetical protein [Archangium sp.]
MKYLLVNACMLIGATALGGGGTSAEERYHQEPAAPTESVQYFARCDEYTRCAGEPVACVLAGDEDGDGGHLIESTSLRPVTYGEWFNTQCGTYGVGWHVATGTCSTGSGTGYKRCKFVYVKP